MAEGVTDDPRRRTLEAAELIAEQYGVQEQAAALERAGEAWQAEAVALLAGAGIFARLGQKCRRPPARCAAADRTPGPARRVAGTPAL